MSLLLWFPGPAVGNAAAALNTYTVNDPELYSWLCLHLFIYFVIQVKVGGFRFSLSHSGAAVNAFCNSVHHGCTAAL